jgi:uncharacterized membrane protein (UPF0127 family)
MNKFFKYFLFLVASIIGIVVLYYFGRFMNYDTAKISLDSTSYKVYLANTPYQQELGLSYSLPLSGHTGMLFSFDKSDTYGFWMKDMWYSLDLIWIDHEMKVVWIEHHISPKTFPHVYIPSMPAQYVLELRSGEAQVNGLSVGDVVKIEK